MESSKASRRLSFGFGARLGFGASFVFRASFVFGVLLLAGCGFQLRGATDMPFKALYTNFPETSPLGSEFKRSFRQHGDARIVSKLTEADAWLDIQSEARDKEIVAFSSTGRPREYQLRLRLLYRVLDAKSNELIPTSELVLRRDIITTDSQLVAKQQEEILLYREMQSDMVQQLVRRLATARPKAP